MTTVFWNGNEGEVVEFSFSDGNGEVGSVASYDFSRPSVLPEVGPVTVTRGTCMTDGSFYDWFKGCYEKDMMREQAKLVEPCDMRVVNRRKVLWPVIYDLEGVKCKGDPKFVDGHVELDYEFEKKVQWPWYKALWWSVRERFSRKKEQVEA